MINKEIKALLKYKFILLSRDNYDFKFTLKYYMIFIPLYIYSICAIIFYENIFFTLSILSIIILGVDYHTIVNKSNVNSLSLFNFVVDKTKSIYLSVLVDVIVKTIILIPILIVSNYKILFLFYGLIFMLFSFFLRELVDRRVTHKMFYNLLFFIYIFFSYIFGNFFFDNLSEKQIQRAEWFDQNFELFFLLLLSSLLFLTFILYLSFNKSFDKIKK
jgi:hypothetical protein